MDERTEVLAAPRRGSGGWRKTRAAGRTFVALVSVATLGATAYGWWAFGGVDEGTATTDVIAQEVEDQRVPLDGAVDMLLVGLDSRTDAFGNPLPKEVMDLLNAGVNDGERNTDTMMLVHIPVDGTRAVAISFPRDSWVELAGGYGNHRLNSAFAYAYNETRDELDETVADPELEERAKVEGRKNLIATVQALIGDSVTIDRYAEVNLASFYEVTTAIGGVEVCLNEAVDERNSGARFPKGKQTIAGAQALAFVRQRYELPNGDLDRIVRQQVFLGALANKVLSADMLTSPSKVRQLVTAVQKSVVLSEGWELSTFAAQMSGLNSGGIEFHTIPVVGDAKIGGADVLEIDEDQVAAFVESLTTDETNEPAPTEPVVPGESAPPSSAPPTTEEGRPSPGLVTVDVRNGSNTKGLAARTLEDLVESGFQAGEIGDTDVQRQSAISYPPGERAIAQLVADALGATFVLEEDRSIDEGHLRVVLGTDFAGSNAGLVGDRLLAGQPGQPDPSGPSVPPSGSSSAPVQPPQISADGLNCVN